MTLDKLTANDIVIRPARLAETAALQALIARSVRGLSAGYYSQQQIELALIHVFGVDTQLIEDGTYFVAEVAAQLAGCGGWSKRKTLFGGDQHKLDEDNLLEPAIDFARIRAFFVDPPWARRGVGLQIIQACETAALAAGFGKIELAATLPGVPLYRAVGYVEAEPLTVPLPDNEVLPILRMTKHFIT